MFSRNLRNLTVTALLSSPAVAFGQAPEALPDGEENPTTPASETAAAEESETAAADEAAASDEAAAAEETAAAEEPEVAAVKEPEAAAAEEPEATVAPETQATGEETTAPPATAEEQASEAEATEDKKEKPTVKLYGKIKPTVFLGTGLESYGRPNTVAPTAAVNPVLSENADEAGLSFQAQQTRFGIQAGVGPVSGKIELDFVDFSQSSPTTSVRPRLRIAEVGWKATPNTILEAGQTWDLVAPLVPHTYNLVGAYFQAGNTAFMRQQIRVRQTIGSFEVAAGVGSASSNAKLAWGNTEYGLIPAGLLRVEYKGESSLRVGLSGLVARLRFADEVYAMAYHGAAHFHWKPGVFDLRAEAYISQNGANTGMLNLSQGYLIQNGDEADVTSLADAGGFVSASANATEELQLYTSVGAAAVLNSDDVPAGVTVIDGTATRTSVGINYNFQARVGANYAVHKILSFYVEPYLYMTGHELAPADEANFDADRIAYGGEFGAVLAF